MNRKCFRSLSLILCIILSFSFLTVNAFASSDDNLIDPDLRNWTDGSTVTSDFSDIDVVSSGAFPGYYAINIYSPFSSAFVYDVTNSVFIDNTYHFSFDLLVHQSNVLFDVYNLEVGVIGISGNGFTNVTPEISYTINKSNYQYYIDNGFSFDFKLSSVIGDAAIIFVFTPIDDIPSDFGNKALCYIGNVSLTRVESNTEGMLDGILGFLKSIVDTLSGLADKIKSDFSTFFDVLNNNIDEFSSNVSSGLKEVWQIISNKLTEVQQNISGEITSSWQNIITKLTNVVNSIGGFFDDLKSSLSSLFQNLINYMLYFDDEVPENPFTAEDSVLTSVQRFIDIIINAISNLEQTFTDVIDSVTSGIYIFRLFVERHLWVALLVTFALGLLVVSRFVGI